MLKGLVISCSTFVPPLSDDWTNKAATAPGFDSIRAAKMLDEAGYRFDKDSKTRIDPKTNKPLNLTIITPMQNTNPVLWDIGYMVTYYINGLGIKADHVALPDYLYQPRAMQSRDYDILVQDITMSQATFSLYPLLHSSRDQGWTYAFSGIHDSALDTKLEQLWFGLDLQAAQKASLDAQNILAKNLPYVAVCSVPVFSAIKGQWDGVVTMPGIGASNIWTYQSIHPADKNQDMILQLTAPGGINSLNPLMASSVAEWRILQQIYSPLLYIDPMSMKDTPLLAGSWNIEAWTAPTGGKGMKVTFHLVDGVKWQDGMPFTSQDIKFCIDFIKSHNVPRYKDIINLVNDVQAPDKLTVEIFLNDRGYRYLYDLVWFTFLPQHIWSDVIDYQTFMPWKEVNPQNKELTKLIGQGLYILKPGDLVNGAQLVRYKEHIFSYNNDKSK
jgi:peptide/nickel transport system substrate-binding protein